MKRIHNYFVVISIFASLICTGQSESNCILYNENGEKLSSYDWRNGIRLTKIKDITKPGEDILYFKAENIEYLDFYEATGDDKYQNYIDVELYDDDFNITIANDFKEYEEHETATTIVIKATFLCGDESTQELEIEQPIIDTNNHDPVFQEAPYKFKLPMPIVKGFDFDFVKQIVARDIDLTNERVTFSFNKSEVQNTGFVISAAGKDPKDKKNFLAKLLAGITMDLEDDITFTLFATDSGTPSRTTETTVTIIVDKPNSLPRFSHPVYIADLSDLKYKKGDKIMLQFVEGNITLPRGYEGVKDFEISGISDENKEHFKLTHSGAMTDYGIVTYVELMDLTEKFLSQKTLSVILSAIKDKTEARTVLNILLPGLENNNPGNETNGEQSKCEEKPAKVGEDDSTNGYMVATIILSLVTVALLGTIVFVLLKRNK